MKRVGLQCGLGLVIVGLLFGLLELSEHERERRHSRRPAAIVNKLLTLAQITPDDVVYDLECGDGQAVVAAAQSGAHGWCFDIYPRRLAEARDRACQAHVENLITFRLQHWDTVDVSPASVVVVWLTHPTGRAASYKLRGQLTRALVPGSRIVAYRPDLGDWQPSEILPVEIDPTEPIRAVKLWVADGTVRPWLE